MGLKPGLLDFWRTVTLMSMGQSFQSNTNNLQAIIWPLITPIKCIVLQFQLFLPIPNNLYTLIGVPNSTYLVALSVFKER